MLGMILKYNLKKIPKPTPIGANLKQENEFIQMTMVILYLRKVFLT